MEDRKKPKRVGIIGNEPLKMAIVKALEETPDPFAPEPLIFKNYHIPYQEPFIEKPRKKRRQHLFKR